VKTIWKFELPVLNHVAVPMPEGACILSLAVQGDGMVVWAEVDPKKPSKARHFYVIGTGTSDVTARSNFLGTVQMPPFVWHVFEAWR